MKEEESNKYFNEWWVIHGDGKDKEIAFKAWEASRKITEIYLKEEK